MATRKYSALGRGRAAELKKRLTASSQWVRYMSPSHPGYRVLVSPRQLQAFGPPRDPWGDAMRPAKGFAPRRIDEREVRANH